MAKIKQNPDDSNIEDVLENLQSDLNKYFGAGSATRLNDPGVLSKVDYWVSTRSMVVDSILRGGRPPGASLLPFGRQVEVSGKSGSGKTTLCAQISAEVQANGGLVVITDTEERVDDIYWTSLGVDVSKVIRIQATDVSEVFNKQYRALQFAREHAADRPLLLIWDSLGGTAGAEMLEMGSDESPMEQASKFGMRQAKVISDGMTLINTIVGQTRACYLYTNHVYTDFNVKYGSPIKTRGGDKPIFMATVRLQLSSAGQIKELDSASGNETVVGQKIRVKALKNSMAGRLMEREAVIMAGRGFVNSYSCFDMGTNLGIIIKSGSWYTWTTPTGEQIKFQGFSGFEDKVVTHPEYDSLYAAVEAEL